MKAFVFLLALLPLVAGAAREDFMQQQAYGEVQRLSGQVDTLQSNFDSLSSRLSRLEGKTGGDERLRAEIDSLKAAVEELKREMQNQREEIVRDLSKRMAKMQPKATSTASASKPKTRVITGPTSTYTVQGGDSLYLIAKAFNTTVAQLREMNGLTSDRLRIGQKLVVPQVQE